MELDFDVIRKHLKHGNEREDKEMFQKWSLGKCLQTYLASVTLRHKPAATV